MDLAIVVPSEYRAFSAPEGRGDYFVGFFFSGSLPTGSPPNGIGHTILTPNLRSRQIAKSIWCGRLVCQIVGRENSDFQPGCGNEFSRPF